MASDVGPIVLKTVGDEYVDPARIAAIVWEGSTTAGDRCVLKGRGPSASKVLWPGRANDTNTYLGLSFGLRGLHAPDGFRVALIDSGELSVYLNET